MAGFLALLGLYIIFLLLAALGQVLVLLRADRQQASGSRDADVAGLGSWDPEPSALGTARSPDQVEGALTAFLPPSALAPAPDHLTEQPAMVSPRFKQ